MIHILRITHNIPRSIGPKKSSSANRPKTKSPYNYRPKKKFYQKNLHTIISPKTNWPKKILPRSIGQTPQFVHPSPKPPQPVKKKNLPRSIGQTPQFVHPSPVHLHKTKNSKVSEQVYSLYLYLSLYNMSCSWAARTRQSIFTIPLSLSIQNDFAETRHTSTPSNVFLMCS